MGYLDAEEHFPDVLKDLIHNEADLSGWLAHRKVSA